MRNSLACGLKLLLAVAVAMPMLGSGVAATKAFQRVTIPGLTDIAEGMNSVAVADVEMSDPNVFWLDPEFRSVTNKIVLDC